MRGALFRIGPTRSSSPRTPHHWFGGDGMVHGFYVEDGKVSYRNRYVRTPKWELEHEHGRALFGAMGNPMTTDPLAIGNEGGVANTNIVWHAGKLLALEEAHHPFAMDPRRWTRWATTASSGQGHRPPEDRPEDRRDGLVRLRRRRDAAVGRMSYGVTGADGPVLRRQDFQAPYASMVHDFMVTRTTCCSRCCR
jgi:carotenoid cleavage dioxygenase